MSLAEYIWLDGAQPVRQLRSKTRFVSVSDRAPTLSDFPEWSFDGSSTNQATGSDSDCLLRPVTFVADPLRGAGNYLVLCEVFRPDGAPHETNTRSVLRAVLDAGALREDPWIGFEQEYTLFLGARPIGFPEHGFPAPQGPYYCSIGADRAFGRSVAERHAMLCSDAGLLFYGLNAEVMPGQWEFQIGYRGGRNDDPSALNVADHLWLARWLLHRAAEEAGLCVSFDNKPMKGDWNGAGMHTNFSTARMRSANGGLSEIEHAVSRLAQNHDAHIALYGDRLEERLTGQHETCSIHEFRSGAGDRGASIRIPLSVALKGDGYFEDRRPGANADPYLVAARLAATVCGIEVAALHSSGVGQRTAA